MNRGILLSVHFPPAAQTAAFPCTWTGQHDSCRVCRLSRADNFELPQRKLNDDICLISDALSRLIALFFYQLCSSIEACSSAVQCPPWKLIMNCNKALFCLILFSLEVRSQEEGDFDEVYSSVLFRQDTYVMCNYVIWGNMIVQLIYLHFY